MFNISMEKDPALSLLYFLFSIAGFFLSISQYYFGQLDIILPSLIINNIFLLSACFFYLNRNKDLSKYFNILTLSAVAIVIQYQLHSDPNLTAHWLLAFPILTYFVLPIYWAVIINISIIISFFLGLR